MAVASGPSRVRYVVVVLSNDTPGDSPLGRLEPVDPHLVWSTEAAFTTWLLANPAALGEKLGIQLVLTAAEHSVGDFRLDVIGRDETTDQVVIVENQLTRSDHDHLGKLLTYAGGTGAVNVVWLSTHFRSEHRAALEWLNTRVDENTRFFAVEIKAVRIDDSRPAPLLDLVVQPNDWGSAVRGSAVAASSARGHVYADFWTRMLQHIADNEPTWTNARTAPRSNWLSLPTGRTGMTYYFSFRRQGQLLCELTFEATNAELNSRRLADVQLRLTGLDADLGESLSYEPMPDRQASRIGIYTPGSIDQTDHWDQYVRWFVDTLRRLRVAINVAGGLPD